MILSQSFFIKNGVAFDYYQNREYSSSYSVMAMNAFTSGYLNWSSLLNKYGYNGHSSAYLNANAKSTEYTSVIKNTAVSGLSRKEKPIVCIPPKSIKGFFEYAIDDIVLLDCDKKVSFPKNKSVEMKYTKETSPLTFKNRITYSFDRDGNNLQNIENEFWVSSIINYNSRDAKTKYLEKNCITGFSKEMIVSKIGSPSMFYNSYPAIISSNKVKYIILK